jgi:hypothetical protein
VEAAPHGKRDRGYRLLLRYAIGGQKKGKHRPHLPRALWLLSRCPLVDGKLGYTPRELYEKRISRESSSGQEAIAVQGLTHWDIRL